MNIKVDTLVKAFVSGGSWPVFLPFFWGFNSLKSQYNIPNMEKILKDYDPYYIYTISAPIYFGTMSIISVLISKYFKINIRLSYFLVSLVSPIIVSSFIKLNNVYNFSDERWKKQYLYLFLFHSFAYNAVMANIFTIIE